MEILLGEYTFTNYNHQNGWSKDNRVKVTGIHGLYKVLDGLSIPAKICDLEWPLSEIQVIDSLNAAKMTIQPSMTPTPCSATKQ